MYLKSHMWLVAIVLDSTALEQRARLCKVPEPKVLGCRWGGVWATQEQGGAEGQAVLCAGAVGP